MNITIRWRTEVAALRFTNSKTRFTNNIVASNCRLQNPIERNLNQCEPMNTPDPFHTYVPTHDLNPMNEATARPAERFGLSQSKPLLVIIL
jgi:hypothetical protein